MPPIPLEGNQPSMSNGLPPEGSLSLSVLIDFIVQRTYHELTVLAELLPRKADMERKIEIYKFANRTRQLFVRLLALVKWANSASKVDKSTQIMGFLDKQSLLFIDTADMLARVARETVVSARLPNFHIPSAVEVLTTGTFSRLPACIRERIVPPDKITPAEKRETLLQLNRVIQHRLVCSNLISEMSCKKVANGRVTFRVENEFQVSLTLMGDNPNIPWRLLDIEILVEDKETGEGKPLVHPLQIQYIHQVVQARLLECCSIGEEPLTQVYMVLHYFCQSLQLEVLFSQTRILCKDRLDGHIHITEYTAGKCIVVSYWRELSRSVSEQFGYSLTVYVDDKEPNKSLSISHSPSLGMKDAEITEKSIGTDQLSMERLLVHTIYVRTKIRLSELKVELENMLKDVECNLQGSPAILSVAILNPCLRAEQLLVTVDTHTGMLQCHVPEFNPPCIVQLQQALNSEHSKIPLLISDLRFWITQRRCEATLQHLPATAYERLPVLHHPDHPMSKISRHRMFIKLHKISNMILIVEFSENDKSPCKIEYKFYLANVKKSSIEDNPNDETIETDIPKMYLKVLTLLTIEKFVATHGPFTAVIEEQQEKIDPNNRKRTIIRNDQPRKIPKHPAYFIPELAHIVALCDERLPFTVLAQELTKCGISNQGVQIEANATTFVLKILSLPPPTGIEPTNSKWVSLCKRLLSISIRVYGKGTTRCWTAEYVFYGSPLPSRHSKEQGARRPVYINYDVSIAENISKTVETILNDWFQIVHLYFLVEDLSPYLQLEKNNLASMISIKSYNYLKLIIGYGTHRRSTATIHWNSSTNGFSIVFGSLNSSINPHNLIKEQFEGYLNNNKKLSMLIHEMLDTLNPLNAICKLPSIPQLCVIQVRPTVPVITFGIVANSTNLIKVIYEGQYCLEITLRWGNLVSVRDGAYSRYDRTSVISDYIPTPGLKAFLSKYVDESSMFRRRSQSEDDNPPSPITMDNVDGNFLSSSSHRGPQSPAQGLRFHPPGNTPPGSNPHTPASPHPAVSVTGISQNNQQFSNSPATSFNLASPPSLPSAINPSPSMLPHPSPGSSLLASSPSNPLHVPSPAGMLSNSSPGPGSGFGLSSSTHPPEVSPFPSQSMTSPAASNWPGSPGLPRLSPARAQGQSPASHSLQSPDHKSSFTHTSRVLPQKSWAGAVPTIITHEALNALCTPTAHPQGLPAPKQCPLERFLGCVYMRKNLQRFVQTEENLIALNCSEPGVVNFKVETLQCRIFINMQHFQSLHLKISCTPEQKDPWTMEELNILEKFFETKVAIPPCKPNTLLGFTRMLNCPYTVLKDFIQIIKLEMIPGLIQQQQMKWAVQWCLRIPPSATPIVPVGKEALLICRNKILFFLQITRIGITYNGNEVPSLVLPLVYDTATNLTQLAEKRDGGPASAISAASLHLKRFAEFALNHNECSIFPAVRDLMTNFVLPSEPQPQMSPASMNMHPQMGPGGPVPSPLMGQHMMNQNSGIVGQNPSMMGQNPGMVGQNPGMVGQNSNMISQNPNIVGQNPCMVGQNSNMMAQNPNIVGQNPNMMTQNPNMIGQNPNAVGQNPNMVGPNSNMVGQTPNMIGQNPNMVVQNPNMVGPGQNYSGVQMSNMGPQHGMMSSHQ
ncbi:mediator of RNA polymerase II transcription subunit 14 [Daktulosphaira vitifoliae]|uniref:mediator of RNA polymerase II transcription subunit 14 n=1 Tax=Daktulosphaira vitifoliae TaxID=58002 RepID=UPI0021A9A6A6|nr:mediator of RNA polymerase II transcription subunit 14 [Daktulosphaira vitifoliae]XP_050538101.1 mediator of RNA polymerase II transcription subunit 14 [Daktulosphaira vitifoliae]